MELANPNESMRSVCDTSARVAPSPNIVRCNRISFGAECCSQRTRRLLCVCLSRALGAWIASCDLQPAPALQRAFHGRADIKRECVQSRKRSRCVLK